MPSPSPRSLVLLALFSMLDISQAAGVPRAPGASVGHAITMTGKHSSSSSAPTSIDDFQDTLYFVDITLGTQQFTVQMDTGSADLWVQPSSAHTIQLANTTNITTTMTYGAGNATGIIEFAQLEFGGFTVPNQAFLLATDAEDFAFLELDLGSGILGLSFENTDFSPINAEIKEAFNDPNTTVGATPIFNILSQDASGPNSFDIQLDRTGDLNDTAVGTFIIGSHLAGFENVTNQPHLPRVFPGRWSIPLDDMTVNGGLFEFNQSSVPGVDSGKIATVLDSGFSLPPLPPPAVDFIYSSIPGAVPYQTDAFQWIVPCTGTTNLSFTFGGIDFPVHYLDLTLVTTTNLTINGQDTNVTFCYNAYQYLTLDPDSFFGFDAILGDAFLRNVYASFNYGEINTSGNESFVQLISTTNFDVALPDFRATRAKSLASLPPELAPADLLKIANDSSNASYDDVSGAVDAASSTPSPSPSSSSSSSPSPVSGSSSSDDRLYSLVKQYGPVVIGLLAGNIIIGIILCIIGLFTCLKTVVRSGVRRTVTPTYAPVRFKEAEAAEESGYRYQD